MASILRGFNNIEPGIRLILVIILLIVSGMLQGPFLIVSIPVSIVLYLITEWVTNSEIRYLRTPILWSSIILFLLSYITSAGGVRCVTFFGSSSWTCSMHFLVLTIFPAFIIGLWFQGAIRKTYIDTQKKPSGELLYFEYFILLGFTQIVYMISLLLLFIVGVSLQG